MCHRCGSVLSLREPVWSLWTRLRRCVRRWRMRFLEPLSDPC